MRIEYDLPNPVIVIADGSSLIYVDRELEQVSAILLSLTPAAILLKDNFSLISKDILITGFHRSPGILRMSIVKAEDPLSSKLTLIFSDKPLELRKWSVVDNLGITTTISLLGPEFGLKLDPKLFDYEIPDFYKNIN
jgi:outer membrane lipoprotein-sorting protein